MKILITGNMGYVGPCVVEHLRNTIPAAQIVGFDIGYFGSCLTNGGRLPECRVDCQYFGDIRNFDSAILEGVDAIVHLAAISNDPIGNKYESVTFDINYKASVRLAAAARKAGVEAFVFASSCSMYGAAEDDARNESSPLNPLTAYAKSKVYTENDLEPMAGSDFKVTSLRFATACGMSDRLRLDLVLNDFVAAALASGRILILSDGTPWRPLISVQDMARAIEWAIGREPQAGGNFLAVNVGSNEWNYQVRDLAEAVAEIIPGVDISINKDAQPDKRSYRVDFKRFEKLAPDHQPQVNVTSAIRELKDGLESIEFKDPDFHNSNLIRLRMLNHLKKQGLLSDELKWVRS
jgi:nucleoside-diphosphate-sugar epimerase